MEEHIRLFQRKVPHFNELAHFIAVVAPWGALSPSNTIFIALFALERRFLWWCRKLLHFEDHLFESRDSFQLYELSRSLKRARICDPKDPEEDPKPSKSHYFSRFAIKTLLSTYYCFGRDNAWGIASTFALRPELTPEKGGPLGGPIHSLE